MDVKINGSKVTITKTLTENETYKIINKPTFQAISFYQKPDWVKGYSSMTFDRKHVLFFDYDDTCYELLKQELEALIEHNKLTDVYIFVSKEREYEGNLIGNYHVVCLSKFLPFEAKRIIGQSNCDYVFKSMPLRKPFRCWVLRISGKGNRSAPQYKETIISKYYKHEISTAHKKIIEKMFNIKVEGKFKEDNSETIYLHDYQTANRLKGDEK